MKVLNQEQLVQVSGGTGLQDIGSAMSGVVNTAKETLWCVGDGIVTGMAVGGSASRSNGLLGPIAQLVGVFVGGITGGIYGVIAGPIFGQEQFSQTAESFRVNFGTKN